MPTSTSSLHRHPLVWALILATAGVALYFIGSPLNTPTPPQLSQHVTQLPQPRPLRPFELTDHRANPFRLENFKGHWSFVFLGYTHCPDVCPTAMLDLKRTVKAIAANAPGTKLPQVVFVSIDPGRDTPEQLSRFVPYFNPDFIGVTGSQDQIDNLSAQLSAVAMRVDDPEHPDNYLMDHSAAILLINPEARLQAIFTPPHEPLIMARDYLEMARYYEESR